jgi:nitroimidazol reductase NimA-like FMN-containing flavoprotein (pyridoxamine 5'-phosphate oxidase superfamily)
VAKTERAISASGYLERPLTRVRRKDRTLGDEEWIERFLRMAAMGHAAVCWDGQPLIHSNLFWYDGRRVYWHTAQVGKFRAVAEQGEARACFTVAEHGRILPDVTPLEFSTEYASVILYGRLRLVADPAEKRYGLEGLMDKYAPHLRPGVDYEPMPEDDVARTSVYCLEIDERVAKHNVKPDDYPAFWYSGGSFIEEERRAGRHTLKPKELA